jgi:tetratricopeptide (TPR) repeat protein
MEISSLSRRSTALCILDPIVAVLDMARRPGDADTVETVRRAEDAAAPPPRPEIHPPADEGPRPGERIGRYHILEIIGRGGMGTVYSAFDPALERRVAIKILHRGQGGAPAERERLLAEAKAMAQLSHPNVVTVHEAAVDRGRVFLAMEFVPGRTARAWLAQRERPWREIVAIYRQAALGLSAAHAAGMIHRDVKADNILVGNDERVRITDFGIAVGVIEASSARSGDDHVAATATPVADDASAKLTITTGTPAYMSPEQLRGDPLDARSDQFSFAITLFEALFRRRPFEGRTPSELRAAHREQSVAVPNDGTVPGWLRRALLRALEIDPAKRWPSMHALAKQLELGTSPIGRPLQRWLLVLIPAGIGVGALVGGRVAGDPVACEQAGAMVQTWNEERKAAVTAALETAGPAFAGNTARTVVKLLDAYGREWTAAYEDACQQHRAGVESDSLFDRRQACLRARHRAVSSLVDILGEADTDTLRNAIAAVDALPRLRECDAARLVDDTTWTLPADGEQRSRHESVLEAMTQVQAMFRAGRFRDGKQQADDVVGAARALADDAVLIRALLLREGFEDKLDQPDAAVTSIDEAWHLALRSGNTIDAVRAAIRQIELVGYEQRNEAVAIARVADAHALIDRVRGRDPELATELEAAVLRAHGIVELRFQRPAAADRLAEALQMVRGLPARHDLEIADYLRALANAEFQLKRHDDALAHYQDALDLAIGVLGPDHPDVAAVHNNIGLLLRNMGRARDGAEHLERALEIALAAFGRGHRSVVMAEGNLASVYHQLGEAARAVPLWEHALGLPVDFADADASVVRRAVEFGHDLLAVGRGADALATFDAALATGTITTHARRSALDGRAGALRVLGRDAEANDADARAAQARPDPP